MWANGTTVLVNTTASRPPNASDAASTTRLMAAGVFDVEFERRATDRLGQLGQQVHAPRRDGYLRAAFGGAGGDGMADSRGCSDDEEA